MRDYFTTGQIARLFGVSPRTAAKWVDGGLLKGWRVPPGKCRRVPRAEIARFAAEHGLHLPDGWDAA